MSHPPAIAMTGAAQARRFVPRRGGTMRDAIPSSTKWRLQGVGAWPLACPAR